MRISYPFTDHYRSALLSSLTSSSDEAGLISPLTDFSIDESEPPSPLMVLGDEEETGKDTAVALGSTELQDAPLYRSFGRRGVSKSCNDILLAALVYRQPDKVCLECGSRDTTTLPCS